jgi:uncharacterized protein YjbI with pentapeptide repeats
MSQIRPISEANNTATETVISEQIFTGQTFSHVQEGAIYINCKFRDTRWIDVNLQHVEFKNCQFENMFCSGMRTTGVQWEACDMKNLDWKKVDLQQSHILDCDVTNWKIDASELKQLALSRTKISHWHLKNCKMQHVTWMDCTAQSLTQLACRTSDVSWIDSKITDARIEHCNLERFITAKASLSEFFLVGCTGSQVRATQSEFDRATFKDNEIMASSWSHSALNDCDFVNCKFPLAGFDHARLNRVSYEHVDMTRAMFDSATVQTSQFNHVQAPNASFRNAKFSEVSFNQSNLTELDGRGFQSDRLKLRDVNCERANLIGQEPEVWSAAQLKGAQFEVSKEFDDRTWWLEKRPGHRVVLS